MLPEIEVRDVSKRFRRDAVRGGGRVGALARYRTLQGQARQILTAPVKRLLGRGRQGDDDNWFWALRDVSFTVEPGESVAVIGRNGAGKSTLLKILSRITRPTAGRAVLRGRVGSLLEVGTSFHPELTGRENIFMNGSILGMSRREIVERFDEIVAFSEIEGFIDTPVKRYSSGMLVRLAFAVAAHLQPEVLLVDEVLAVGDAAFQKKCLGKMGETAREGRTVLFVSHNMTALERLCQRALWIDQGRLVQDGPVTDVIESYLRTSFSPATERVWDDPETAPGNDDLRLVRASVCPEGGRPSDRITIRTPLLFSFEYVNNKAGSHLTLVMQLCTERGEIVFSSESVHESRWHGRPFPAGRFRSTCRVPGDLLNDGTHSVRLMFRLHEGLVVHEEDAVLTLDVRDDVAMRGSSHNRWPGVVRPALRWETDLLEASPDPTVPA